MKAVPLLIRGKVVIIWVSWTNRNPKSFMAEKGNPKEASEVVYSFIVRLPSRDPVAALTPPPPPPPAQSGCGAQCSEGGVQTGTQVHLQHMLKEAGGLLHVLNDFFRRFWLILQFSEDYVAEPNMQHVWDGSVWWLLHWQLWTCVPRWLSGHP